ncbi:MAG: MFS transporter [Alphaproteobacteria bacterium]|nr:MFS transporter [Alphaproteobacteria bacterium]MBO6628910.1 MFS transporter [Alphaproteobacteria bacterium]MDF1625888.1 MFS transporter [Parvibaculaceae bacterium]
MAEEAKGGASPLARSTLFAFALPAVPIAAMGLPLAVHIPPFYAKVIGLDLATIGLLFMVVRFWDVFTDPVLGVLSDRFETKWGRRRHWIVASVPIMLLSVFMVFMPPFQTVGPLYLLFWMLVLYVGWTLLTISHMSWGAELTPSYNERSRVQGAREIALILGMVFVLLLPVVIEQTISEDVDRLRVGAMGLFVIILLPITVLIAVTRVGEQKTPRPKHVPFKEAVAVLARNRPLRLVLICDLLGGVGGGLVASLFLFLAEDALKLGAFSGILLLCYFISGVICIPFWIKLSERIGKHRATAVSALFSGVTVPLILFVPEGHGLIALICWVTFGLNMAAGPFLYRSIMADVADHDAIETEQQRTGLFYSLLTMTNKVGAAFAVFIGFTLLDQIGFKAGGENSDEILSQLRMVYVWPAVLVSVAVAVIIWRFPLDEATQVENRKVLERRSLDAAAAAIIDRTGEPSDAQSSGISAD